MERTNTSVDERDEWHQRILGALQALRRAEPLSDAHAGTDEHRNERSPK